MARPDQIWHKDEKSGTYVAEISDLSGNGLIVGGHIQLMTTKFVSFRDWDADMQGDEVTGWRKTFDGVQYLVIND